MTKSIAAAALLFVMTATAAFADTVTVKGVHLCCGACVSAAGKSLKNVDGVSDAACDRNSKTVTFKATDAKAAEAGILALAKAGFHGKAVHGGKALAFPASGARKGKKANEVTVTGVHLCCAACVTGAQKALENVVGVATIEIDRNAKSVTAKGKAISVAAFVAALNKGGFHGRVKTAGN